MEMPIQKSLFHMEMIGMSLNHVILDNLRENISDHIERLEKEMFRLHGKRFSVNSTKAVAQVVRIYRKNGKGAAKCTRKDLLHSSNPIAKLILEHRSLFAILSNTILPLIKRTVDNR